MQTRGDCQHFRVVRGQPKALGELASHTLRPLLMRVEQLRVSRRTIVFRSGVVQPFFNDQPSTRLVIFGLCDRQSESLSPPPFVRWVWFGISIGDSHTESNHRFVFRRGEPKFAVIDRARRVFGYRIKQAVVAQARNASIDNEH